METNIDSRSWEDVTHEERVARWENVHRVFMSLDEHARTKHFDMEHWIFTNECGTIGCIAGHCGLDPYFASRGLKPSIVKEIDGTIRYYEGAIPDQAMRLLGTNGFDRVFRYGDWKNEHPTAYDRTPTWEEMKPILEKFIEDLRAGRVTKESRTWLILGNVYLEDGTIIEGHRA